MITLRPIQERTRARLRSEYARGRRRILVVAPTGFGKTVLLAAIVAAHIARGGRALVVVHRRALVAQTLRKLLDAGVPDVGVIAAGFEPRPYAPVQVAMVQTLAARDAYPEASLVILDEAHHFVAAEWRAVADHYASVLTIGFTATPERADGTPLGDVFESMIVASSVRELVALALLVPCDVIAPPRKTRTLCEDELEAWQKHAAKRRGVVFAASVEDARETADRFSAHGLPAACVEGATSDEERASRFAALERGDLQVITNCFVLTEGWDCPPAEVCMLARGCDSTATFLQMVGRVLRPHPGKTSARLIDLRGVVHDHGLPDDDRTFSLEGRPISGGGEAPLKTCATCSLVVPLATRTCPGCGLAFPAPEREPDLLGLTKIERADRERGYFAGLVHEARERGYRQGWIAHRFKEKCGRFPAKLWREFFPKEAA